MNLEKINTLRASMGLAPITKTAQELAEKSGQKKREAANRAMRAEESRRLKDARQRRK